MKRVLIYSLVLTLLFGACIKKDRDSVSLMKNLEGDWTLESVFECKWVDTVWTDTTYLNYAGRLELNKKHAISYKGKLSYFYKNLLYEYKIQGNVTDIPEYPHDRPKKGRMYLYENDGDQINLFRIGPEDAYSFQFEIDFSSDTILWMTNSGYVDSIHFLRSYQWAR